MVAGFKSEWWPRSNRNAWPRCVGIRNEEGIDGLSNRRSPVLPALMTPAQLAAFKALLEQGPDPASDGIVCWRCSDLQARLQSDFAVQYHERSVGKLLAKLAFRKMTARPFHPEQDAAAQETHKKSGCPDRSRLPPYTAGKPLEIWWQDEARVGQQGTLTRGWATRGSRPAAPRARRYTWAYVIGAVCLARGVGAGIVMPSVNFEATSEHLREVSRNVAPGAHCVMQVDGAGWHRPSERLIVPSNITLLTLPPYSPELNLVENVWQYLRSNWLSHRV